MRKLLITGIFIGGISFALVAKEKEILETEAAQDLPGVEQRSDLQDKVFQFDGNKQFTSKGSRPKMATGFTGRSSLSPGQSATGFDKKVSLKEFSADKKFPVGTSSLASKEQSFFQIQKRFEASDSPGWSASDRARESGKKSPLGEMRYQGPEVEKLLARSDKPKDSDPRKTQFEKNALSVEQIREILNKN